MLTIIQHRRILCVVNLIQRYKGGRKMTNTELLKKVIERSGLKIGTILQCMKIKSYSTLQAKIEGRREFTASEIAKMCEVLHLNKDQMEEIFFALDAEYHSA